MSDRDRLHALGAAVAGLRESRSVSLEAAARGAGLRSEELSAIERGDSDPTYRTLTRIVDGVEATPLELFEQYDACRSAARG